MKLRNNLKNGKTFASSKMQVIPIGGEIFRFLKKNGREGFKNERTIKKK